MIITRNPKAVMPSLNDDRDMVRNMCIRTYACSDIHAYSMSRHVLRRHEGIAEIILPMTVS